MKKYKNMTRMEKLNLMAYSELLSIPIDQMNEDQKRDLFKLAEYCLENELEIEALPEVIQWSEQAEAELMKCGPEFFKMHYPFEFVDQEGQIIDIDQLYAIKNPAEMKYREGLRKGLSHRDASLYAIGRLSPEFKF